MHALVACKARAAARTLLARAGGVWMWPGIALTEKRGAARVPITADAARFWISRLHGPQAIDSAVLRCLASAAQHLTAGDEAGAQRALDSSGLTRLSSDGVVLMRAVAGALGIGPLDLPWAEGPRLWRAEDIEAHLPLFKDHAPAAALLAKAGVRDESKHPRWPAGSEDHQGGRFNHGEGGAVTEGRSASKTPGSNRSPSEESPKVPQDEPPKNVRYGIIKDVGRWALQAVQAGAEAIVEQVYTDLEAIAWITHLGYNIVLRTLLDEPKSLEELQRAVDEPAPGYQIHHIVEQKAADDDGFTEAQYDSRDNLVLIPTIEHREITGWFMTPNDSFNGLSPREYLRGKSWDERRRVGIEALIEAGVLKP